MHNVRKLTDHFPCTWSMLSSSAKIPIWGGCILMLIRASVFRIIHFIIPLNWEIRWRYMLFKGRLLYDFHPVCRWIMSGISVLLSVGNNMMNTAIGTMTLSVLKSMRISIWALSWTGSFIHSGNLQQVWTSLISPMEIRVIPMEVSILSEGESALYVPLMPKIRRPEQLLPNAFT